jgi:hypothetical protein
MDAERECRNCDHKEDNEGNPEPGSVSSADWLGWVHEREDSASQLVQPPHMSRLPTTPVLAADLSTSEPDSTCVGWWPLRVPCCIGVVWVCVRYRHSAMAFLGLAVGIATLVGCARSPSPVAISTLKNQVPGLMLADMNLLDLPANPGAQQQALDADTQGTLRQAVLRVWDSRAAGDRLRDVESNRQAMVADRADVYDEVRASVVSWDAISGSANNAQVRVTVSAAVRRAATGAWDRPGRTQWQFGLRKQSDGTWKLTSARVTAYLSGQG